MKKEETNMKIYEVEFNANAPTKKQISVPLNTNYGVDVSMVCNGEKASQLSVSIDGVDYPTNVVQLKSGDTAKAEVKEVTANGIVGIKALGMASNYGVPSMNPPIGTGALKAEFSGLTINGLRPGQLYWYINIGQDDTGKSAGEIPWTSATDETPYAGVWQVYVPNPSNPNRPTALLPLPNSEGKYVWRTSTGSQQYDTLDIAPDYKFTVYAYSWAGYGTGPGTVAIMVGEDEMLQKKFDLVVNEEDKGYYDKSLGFTGEINLSGETFDGTSVDLDLVTV